MLSASRASVKILENIKIKMADIKGFTTIEVARLCRVSDATVKRWEEAGLLKSERTSGGHRRFRAEEVARFQREQNLGLKQNHGDESVLKTTKRARDKKKRLDSALFQSLIDGGEEAAANSFIVAHLEGKPLAEIIDRVVCPAMREVGELWHRGEISVTQEHLATRTAISAIYKLRSALPVPEMKNRLAMCCAMEGDLHELPTLLAQITIENEGLEVVNFGASTPLYSLADEVKRHSPDFVCISAAVITDLERLSRDYKDFREKIEKLEIPILLGGRIFEDEYIRRRFESEFYARSFTDVARFARNLDKN
jgi:MerR family transcriptional regulator, light-induced transcriptional regulator